MKTKHLVLLLSLLLQTASLCSAFSIHDGGPSHINIMEAQVQNEPKGSSIQATIDGHYLTVVFLENLGLVQVEISTAMGVYIDVHPVYTPNGLVVYVPYTGNFIVTFTLENGDEYYGEFEVTD